MTVLNITIGGDLLAYALAGLTIGWIIDSLKNDSK